MAEEGTNTGTAGEGSESATDTGQQAPEQLGEGGKKALDAERRARSAAEKQAATAQKQLDDLSKRLKQYEDRDKSELDKLTDRATTAEKEAESARSKLLRYQVAADKKLPPHFAARLQGSTQEELEQDADSLLELLKERQPVPASFDGGVRKTAQPTDMNTLIRRQAGRG